MSFPFLKNWGKKPAPAKSRKGATAKGDASSGSPFFRDLDTPLLKLSGKDVLCIREVVTGILVTGGIGSGKTSAHMELASALLRCGAGFLINTAKFEDIAMWRALVRANGREADLIEFDETQGYNFINAALARHGVDGMSVVIETILAVLDAANRATGNYGSDRDPFWAAANRQLLSVIVPANFSAWGKVTMDDIMRFAMSAAIKSEQYMDPAWAADSYAAQTLERMAKRPVVTLDPHTRQSVLEYFFTAFPRIPEKTRGSVLINLSAALDRFKTGRMQRMFCDATSVLPEMTLSGKIILMCIPVLTHREDGIVGQILFKNAWQACVEGRRSLGKAFQERLVVNWADEAQYFFTGERDDMFLSTARSARCCVVNLTQSIPTMYSRAGKDRSDSVDGYIGKFLNVVCHLNNCNRTNRWVSEQIGRGVHWRKSRGENRGTTINDGMTAGSNAGESNQGGGWFGNRSTSDGQTWGTNRGRGSSVGTNTGESEHMDYIFEPNFFSTALKSGGPKNGNLVTAVWVRAGANFKTSNGASYVVCTFKQGGYQP